MTKHTYGYGPHLMLDLNNCNPAILDNLEACFKLLNELPERIGMTKITQPYVFRYSAPVLEDEGRKNLYLWTCFHASHLMSIWPGTISSNSFNQNPLWFMCGNAARPSQQPPNYHHRKSIMKISVDPGAYGAIPEEFCWYETASIAILPVPYDGTPRSSSKEL